MAKRREAGVGDMTRGDAWRGGCTRVHIPRLGGPVSRSAGSVLCSRGQGRGQRDQLGAAGGASL